MLYSIEPTITNKTLQMEPDQSPHYWDRVSRTFTRGAQQSLWRAHSDWVNMTLLEDWLGGRQFADILKTDLFDEAVSQGLYPFLRERAHTIHGIDVAAESVDRAKKQFPELKALCANVRSLLPFRLLKSLHLVPYFVGKSHGKRGLTLALEKAGFKVLETRAIMHCPRVLAVAVAGVLQKRASENSRQRYLALLEKFECLARLPTRYFSGYFVAVRALKPAKQGTRD